MDTASAGNKPKAYPPTESSTPPCNFRISQTRPCCPREIHQLSLPDKLNSSTAYPQNCDSKNAPQGSSCQGPKTVKDPKRITPNTFRLAAACSMPRSTATACCHSSGSIRGCDLKLEPLIGQWLKGSRGCAEMLIEWCLTKKWIVLRMFLSIYMSPRNTHF